VKLDSKEGIARFMDWARAHDIVLNEGHERLAKKHGVPTDGVVITRQIPVGGRR
jgi:hypothetical protein